jgi:excisionase family DNA binding protein
MSDTTNPPRLLRIREVAEMLAVSVVTVYRMCEAGDLPSITLGRARRVPERVLLEWIAKNVKGGGN